MDEEREVYYKFFAEECPDKEKYQMFLNLYLFSVALSLQKYR